MQNLVRIVENTLVGHTAFAMASDRLEQCFKYAKAASEPICLAIVGESRTGKSRVLEECEARHSRYRTSEGLFVPVLRVRTPSKPTVKSLAELMLASMGDPKAGSGTENSKTLRLRTLMGHAETQLMMVDEFQHFHDKGSNKIMHHVADWLKILVDDTRAGLVVSGLSSCQSVLEQNEQLAGRFLAPVVMPRFNWKDDNHRDEFISILESFRESIGQHFDIPDLCSDEMAFRCYAATGGLMGYLTKFLRQAVWNALDAKSSTIGMEQLSVAHHEAVWSKVSSIDMKSPFSRDFMHVPTEDMLARILHIGLPKAQSETTRRLARSGNSVGVLDVMSTRGHSK